MIEIAVAVITGVATVIAVVLTNGRNNRDMDAKLDKSLAVTQAKLEELTREVREHNNFARRLPVVEKQIEDIERRIENLEKIA